MTCFGAIAILRNFTPVLLKRTAIKQFYSDREWEFVNQFTMHGMNAMKVIWTYVLRYLEKC